MTGARPRGLGAELRRLRTAAGMSQPELAQRCGWSHSKISRIETGVRPPTETEIATILATLGVVGDDRENLLQLARNSTKARWWEVGNPGLPQQLTALVEIERDATAITGVEMALVPGLLQTAEYARAVVSLTAQGEQLENRVSVRLGRQSILTRAEPKPVLFTAVIDESVLYRPFGGSQVMAAQIRHLAHIATRPNIHVHVLPMKNSQNLALLGSFDIFDFERGRTIVYVEQATTGLFLDSASDIEPYVQAVPLMHNNALSEEETIQLFLRRAEELGAQCDLERSG